MEKKSEKLTRVRHRISKWYGRIWVVSLAVLLLTIISGVVFRDMPQWLLWSGVVLIDIPVFLLIPYLVCWIVLIVRTNRAEVQELKEKEELQEKAAAEKNQQARLLSMRREIDQQLIGNLYGEQIRKRLKNGTNTVSALPDGYPFIEDMGNVWRVCTGYDQDRSPVYSEPLNQADAVYKLLRILTAEAKASESAEGRQPEQTPASDLPENAEAVTLSIRETKKPDPQPAAEPVRTLKPQKTPAPAKNTSVPAKKAPAANGITNAPETEEEIRTLINKKLAGSLYAQQIEKKLCFRINGVYLSNPHDVPYIEHTDNGWRLAAGFDDMRGPHITNRLSLEDAVSGLIRAAEAGERLQENETKAEKKPKPAPAPVPAQKPAPAQKSASAQNPPAKPIKPDVPLNKAVEILRGKIIEKLRNSASPVESYCLAALLWDDAHYFDAHWDGAWIYLDLKTHALSVMLSTYPGSHGYSQSSKTYMTAERFHDLAQEKKLEPELRAFRTDADWDRLFDDELLEAVAENDRKLAQEREATRLKYGIVIPEECYAEQPKRNIQNIRFWLLQGYGQRWVTLKPEAGKYVLSLANINEQIGRTLTDAEAVFVEKELDRMLRDHENKTWQSMAGGDGMTITVERDHKIVFEQKAGAPIRRFSDYMILLEKLARYGSRRTKEAEYEGKPKFRELFAVSMESPEHMTTVVYDETNDKLYHAEFRENHVGGAYFTEMAGTGDPISAEDVRKLAEKAENSNAFPFRDLTEKNRNRFLQKDFIQDTILQANWGGRAEHGVCAIHVKISETHIWLQATDTSFDDQGGSSKVQRRGSYQGSYPLNGKTANSTLIFKCIQQLMQQDSGWYLYEQEMLKKVEEKFGKVKEQPKAEKPKQTRKELKSIEEAAACSKMEKGMRPGGISEYSRERKFLHTLFRTNRGPTGWGVSDEVVVDERTNTPYWIVTQYDGQMAAQTWYLDKKKLTFAEVRAYAKEESPETFQSVRGINADNWREFVKEK